MGTISPQQVNDNDAIVKGLWNNPVNTIANEINGNLDNANIKSGAAIDSSKISFTTSGLVVQVKSTNYTALASGSTVLPYDDTIPQITEGNEFMTQAITPKSASNRLSIEATLFLSSSSGTTDMSVALFQDATANALAATDQTHEAAAHIENITIRHDMVAGTTSSTTFRVRAGTSGAGTTYFNGAGGLRRFGGITVSNIKITEYIP